MTCFNPVSLPNPEFGTPYDVYQSPYIHVPCGRCSACIVNNASEWRTRLEIETDVSVSSWFVTLTYDDSALPVSVIPDTSGNPVSVSLVSKRDIQLFLKRLRKRFRDVKIRYFIVSEYGPLTLRPHYHGVIFGLPRLHPDDFANKCKITQAIKEVWDFGHVVVDPVTFGRISYVTKYLSCVQDLPPYYPKPFRLMSRKPGIGSSYFENKTLLDWHRENLACYYPDGRFKRRLPRYFKDKIFDDAMKIEIREQIKERKDNETQANCNLARTLGYNNSRDMLLSQRDAFKRHFDKKLNKSRKNG